MLGLGDIEFLNQARIPGLAITLYVIFVILTYVLLMNSLIAMMSQTCALVLQDRYSQWRLQQLSVILFMEDLFCLPCYRRIFGSPGTERKIGAFDPITAKTTIESRYFLKIHSLQPTYATEEDREVMEKTLKEHSLHVDDEKRVKRVKSVRLRKQIIRVIEEGFKKQTAMLLGSKLDLSKSEKTPDTESRNTPQLDVHTHIHDCPEIRERLVRNGHLHVDVEPYQYSNA
jgi:hypothetical protein